MNSKTRQLSVTFGCLLLACLLGGAARAQSGRRPPQPRAEAPVPTPTPEPPKVPPASVPDIKLFVTNSSPPSMYLATIDSDILMNTFVQRLRAAKSLQIQTGDRMNRESARKRAKQQEEARFVVWLELQVNGMATDPSGVLRPNPEDLHIQYIVYEPGTGNMRVSGNVYLRPVRSLPGGRTTVPACYPNRYYGIDGALMAGAIETAARIFEAFTIPNPPLCP